MSLPRGKGVFFVFRASQAHSWTKRGNSSKLLSWMKGINGCCPVRSLALDPKPPFLEQCVRAPLCGFEAPMNIQSSHDDHDMQKMDIVLSVCRRDSDPVPSQTTQLDMMSIQMRPSSNRTC